MTHETYILVLCIIVYVLMVSVSVAVIVALTKMSLRLITHGAEDEQIIKEAKKERKKSGTLFETVFSAFFCVLFACAFGFSLYVNVSGETYFDGVPTLKVVNSPSMSQKLKENEYLFENELNDQFDTFDVVLTYKIPDEFALELYDIVVYEMEGILVIHRIVEIEEPNATHPEHRYFRTQGDNVSSPDRFPVLYSQMRAIYRGEKIQFVGSFINFMQSPAGWLCMILMLAVTISTPIVDSKLEKARKARYELISKQAKKNVKPTSQNVTTPLVCFYPVYHDPVSGAPILQPPFAPPNAVGQAMQPQAKEKRK